MSSTLHWLRLIEASGGVAAANLMFSLSIFCASEHVRAGPAQWWSEFVATFGHIGVIIGCSRSRPAIIPFTVAAYITSGRLVNIINVLRAPGVTLAHAATNTFADVRPGDASGFIAAQLLGAAVATGHFLLALSSGCRKRRR